MSELRKCENCIHYEQQYNARQSERYNQCFHPKTEDDLVTCETARNTFCGVSAVYFEQSEPSIENLESMFDRDDTKPKTPPSIFSKENEGIF